MTTIRSAILIVEKRCEIRIVVQPRARVRQLRNKSYSALESRLDDGSSRITTEACRANARANTNRCQCPTERLCRSPRAQMHLMRRELSIRWKRKSDSVHRSAGESHCLLFDGLNRNTFVGCGKRGSTHESTAVNLFDTRDRLTQSVDSITGTIIRTYDLLDRARSDAPPDSVKRNVGASGPAAGLGNANLSARFR